MTEKYAAKQFANDQVYRDEFLKFVASLPPELREEYRKAGVDSPLMPHTKATGCEDHDMADDPQACEWPDMASALDSVTESPVKPAPSNAGQIEAEEMWAILRRVFADLLAHKDAKLSLECLALISGVQFSGNSMVEIAKKHAVSRAAVSKRCVELCARIGLPPSRAMRSVGSRLASRIARRQAIARQEGLL